MVLALVSFFSGILTVLAPCILPLLPIIIGSGAGARSRYTPYIVIGSLSVSILLFTFLLKVSTLFIMVPTAFWSYFSGAIVIVVGLIFAFPTLWELMPGVGKLSTSSNQLLGAGHQKKSAWGDIIIGASLGPVFSSCSPTYFYILGSVLPASFLVGTVYLLFYIAGLASVLLLIALTGQKYIANLTWAANPHGWFKRSIGVLFLIVGLLLITGVYKDIEAKILESGFNTVQFETSILEKRL